MNKKGTSVVYLFVFVRVLLCFVLFCFVVFCLFVCFCCCFLFVCFVLYVCARARVRVCN